MSQVAEAFRWLARCLHLFQVGGRRWQNIEQEMFTTGGWGITKFDPELDDNGIRTAPRRKERRAAARAARRAA